jgi:hypothetical protein
VAPIRAPTPAAGINAINRGKFIRPNKGKSTNKRKIAFRKRAASTALSRIQTIANEFNQITVF